ncbi:MAG: type II secretion system protein GspM [Pseudomonadota bacterium]
MDKLLSWWEGLESREQMMVAIGGFILALLLFYLLAVAPLMSWHKQEEKRLAQTTEDLKEVKQLVARIQANDRGNSGGGNQNLAAVVDSSLRSNQLEMKGFQPGANNDARLRLENAPYPALAQWLYELEYQHSLTVLELGLNPSSIQGRLMVSIRLGQ